MHINDAFCQDSQMQNIFLLKHKFDCLTREFLKLYGPILNFFNFLPMRFFTAASKNYKTSCSQLQRQWGKSTNYTESVRDHCVCSQNQNNERLQIAREREHRYIAAEQEDKVQKTIAKSPLKSCTLAHLQTCKLAHLHTKVLHKIKNYFKLQCCLHIWGFHPF